MLEHLLLYCLSIWATFFFLNYAEISTRPANWLKRVACGINPLLAYPLSCAFCWCGWVSIVAWSLGYLNALQLFAAPVVHLFIDLAYTKLGGSGRVFQSDGTLEDIQAKIDQAEVGDLVTIPPGKYEWDPGSKVIFTNQQPPQGSVTLP